MAAHSINSDHATRASWSATSCGSQDAPSAMTDTNIRGDLDPRHISTDTSIHEQTVDGALKLVAPKTEYCTLRIRARCQSIGSAPAATACSRTEA